MSPAAGVAGRLSPTHDQGGGLGAEQREAHAHTGLTGEAPGGGLGSGHQAGEGERVGQRSVAQRGVEQATVRIVGAATGHLTHFCQLGQVLLNLCEQKQRETVGNGFTV